MKYLGISLLLVLTTTAATPPPEDWFLYKEIEGNFEILLPIQPVLKEHAGFRVISTNFHGVNYQVSYSLDGRKNDFTDAQEHIREYFKEYKTQLKKRDFHVRAKEKVFVYMLGLPAEEIEIVAHHGDTKLHILYRVLIASDHTYQFEIKTENKIDRGLADKFFNSFVLLNNRHISLDWHDYKSETGGFSVDLPSEPVDRSTKTMEIISTQVGDTNYQVSFPTQGQSYDVNNYEKILTKTSEDYLERIAEKIPIEVVEEKDLKMKDYPAKELRIKTSSQGIEILMIHRILLTPQQIYHFHILRAYDEVDANSAQRFFNSFQLQWNE